MSRKNQQKTSGVKKISGPYYLWLQPSIPTADRFINNFQPTIRNSLSGARKRDIQWGPQVLHEHIRSFCTATLLLPLF
jgi:hypothetical protein